MKQSLFVVCAVLCACGAREIVIDEHPPGPDGGLPPHRLCRTRADCPPDAFCELDSCSGQSGHCEHQPFGDCPELLEPQCGCDGVTYWNECLRLQHGVSKQADAECSASALCGAGQPECPASGAFCAHILTEPRYCSTAPVVGSCWVLPLTCPPPRPGEGCFASCGPPAIRGLCDAVRSEHAYARVPCP